MLPSSPARRATRTLALFPVDPRGSHFSGIPEGVAAALVFLVYLAVGGHTQTPAVILVVAAAVASAASSGRYPYRGLILSGFLLVFLVLRGAGPMEESGLTVYFTSYIVLEAVATTAHRGWLVLALLFHLGLYAGTLPWLGQPGRSVTEFFFSAIFFVMPVGVGLLRHRRRADQDVYARERQAELAAMRRDIARDLHDSIAHDITAIVLRAGQARAASPSPEVAGHLDQIIVTGQRSLHDLRTMLTMLRRDGDVDEPMWNARKPELELQHSRQRLRDAGFAPDVTSTGDLTVLTSLMDDVVAKSLVECVSNVIKHGEKGTTVTIRLEVDDGVELLVMNTVREVPRALAQGGLGLIGVTERVESSGGTVEAGRQGNGLWVTHLSIPLDVRPGL